VESGSELKVMLFEKLPLAQFLVIDSAREQSRNYSSEESFCQNRKNTRILTKNLAL
jgi:hypothetical protein